MLVSIVTYLVYFLENLPSFGISLLRNFIIGHTSLSPINQKSSFYHVVILREIYVIIVIIGVPGVFVGCLDFFLWEFVDALINLRYLSLILIRIIKSADAFIFITSFIYCKQFMAINLESKIANLSNRL